MLLSILVLREPKKITIPCSGLYVISLMMTVTFNDDVTPSLDIKVRGRSIFNLKDCYHRNGTKTVTFFRIFELESNDLIEIHEEAFELDESASFALIKLKEYDEDPGSLQLGLQFAKTSNYGDNVIHFDGDVIDPRSVLQKNSTKLKVDEEYPEFVYVESYGLFVVSLDLILENKMDNEFDVSVTLAVTSENDNTDIEYDYGIGVARKELTYQIKGRTRLCINGIVELPANTYVSLKLFGNMNSGANLQIHNNSRLSLTQIPMNVLVAAVETIKENTKLPKCNDDDRINFRNLPVPGYDLNKYILQNETKFNIPSDGVYLVHFNQTTIPSVNNPLNFTVFLSHTRKGRVLSTVMHVLHPRDGLLNRGFSRLILLKQGDSVELTAECGKLLFTTFRMNFVLVAMPTDFNFRIEDRNHSMKNTASGKPEPTIQTKSFGVRNGGVYFVLFNLLLRFENLQKTKNKKIALDIKRNSKAQNTFIVNEIRELHSVTIGTDGLVSISCEAFLEMTLEDRIHLSLSYDPSESFSIYTIEEHISYVLLSNGLHTINGFRMVQSAPKLFTFVSRVATPNNFQLSRQYGGFKQKGTPLYGSHFEVTKQMVIFYVVSVTFENVIGTFWLSLQVSPERGNLDITRKVTITEQKKTVTLKASGLMWVKAGETVAFLVHSDSDSNVVLSNNVWSLMEITPPNGKDYKEFQHEQNP